MECDSREVDGRQVGYRTCGPPGAPVILCLHGLSLHSGMYDELGTALGAKGWRVIAIDFFGRGYSPWPYGEQCSVGLLVEQCIGLLDALDVDKTALVTGHSMGGGVAVALAARHPERVERLCATAPVGLSNGTHLSPPLPLRLFFALPPSLGAWLWILLGGTHIITGGQEREYGDEEGLSIMAQRQVQLARENLTKFRAHGFVTSWLSTLRHFALGHGARGGNLEADYARLSSLASRNAVAFVWGTADAVCPLDADALLALVPNAALRLAPRVGHGLLAQEVHLVEAEILRLLQEAPPLRDAASAV